MAGLRRARQDGFTHALQVDADGQHDLEAVDRLPGPGPGPPGGGGRRGAPVRRSVPPSRHYWRHVHHFWVWVATLSMDIQDSLCGFRLYPLDADRGAHGPGGHPPAHGFRHGDHHPPPLGWGAGGERAGGGHLPPGRGLPLPPLAGHPAHHLDAHPPGLPDAAPGAAPAGPAAPGPALVPPPGTGHPAGVPLHGRGCCACWGRGRCGPWPRGLVPYFFAHQRAGPAGLPGLPGPPAGPRPAPCRTCPGDPGLGEVYRHFRASPGPPWTRSWPGPEAARASSWTCGDLEAFLALHASGRGALILGAHLGNLEMLRALGQGRGLAGPERGGLQPRTRCASTNCSSGSTPASPPTWCRWRRPPGHRHPPAGEAGPGRMPVHRGRPHPAQRPRAAPCWRPSWAQPAPLPGGALPPGPPAALPGAPDVLRATTACATGCAWSRSPSASNCPGPAGKRPSPGGRRAMLSAWRPSAVRPHSSGSTSSTSGRSR